LKTRSVLSALALLTCAAASRPLLANADGGAGPIDKAACLDAVGKGQRFRDTHKLVEARQKFRVCARAECPTVVQTDCAGWLADVEKTLPTVVLSARIRGGRDVVDVSVTMDDAPLVGTLDGQAVPVNPGLHTFRFERASGPAATVQKLVKEGEKAQGVVVVFSTAETLGAAPGPSSEAPSGPSRTPAMEKPGNAVRILGLLIGGAGVLGMGAGTGLAIDAKSKDNTAANEPGALRQTDSASAVGEGNVATVLLGVGAAMAVAGVVLWVVAPSTKSDRPAAPVSVRTPGLAIGTHGRGFLLWGSF